MIVLLIWVAVNNPSARIRGARQFSREGQCRLREQCRIDAVVHERSFQCDLAASIAAGRSKGRKVARQHCRGWYKCRDIRGILANRRTLIPAEEKQLVPGHRSAQRSTELVALD